MPLNIATIGTGKIADLSLTPAIRNVEGIQLWSVLSRDRKRAQDFAELHGAASPNPIYTDYVSLLADRELDAVLIATPDKLHGEQIIQAARAGKHVLVEKPMVTDLKSGQTAIAACSEVNVLLGVAYHLRWHAGHRKLFRAICDGVLGKLHHMRVLWTFQASDDSDWRASEPLGRWWSLAVGTHCLDIIRWIMVPNCGEVIEVQSLIARDFWASQSDETACILLRFESGATAELTSSALFESDPKVEIYGRKGSAVCCGTFGPHGRGEIFLNGEPLLYDPSNPYEGEIADFVAAIKEGRAPEVDGEEGLRNVEILVQADPR